MASSHPSFWGSAAKTGADQWRGKVFVSLASVMSARKLPSSFTSHLSLATGVRMLSIDLTDAWAFIRILPHTSLSTGLADINPNLCNTMASSQHKIFRDQAGALLISLQSSLQ